MGATFGDVDCAYLTSPVVKVFEEMLMDTLKVSEVIRGEFEINFTGSDCRKVVFSLIERGIVANTKAIAQNGRA